MLSKKENQQRAGRRGQQEGESLKGHCLHTIRKLDEKEAPSALHSQLWLELFPDLQNQNFRVLGNLQKDDGSCSKPDIVCSVQVPDNATIKNTCVPISLKIIDQKTTESQCSVHSVSSFLTMMLNSYGVTCPIEVGTFLKLFTGAQQSFDTTDLSRITVCAESRRRKRLNLEEIDSLDATLWPAFRQWIIANKKAVLDLILIAGEFAKSGKLIQDKHIKALLVFRKQRGGQQVQLDLTCGIEQLYSLLEASRIVEKGKTAKSRGATTIKLFDGIISVQMKGSGQGEAYHGLQWRINYTQLKRYLECTKIKPPLEVAF